MGEGQEGAGGGMVVAKAGGGAAPKGAGLGRASCNLQGLSHPVHLRLTLTAAPAAVGPLTTCRRRWLRACRCAAPPLRGAAWLAGLPAWAAACCSTPCCSRAAEMTAAMRGVWLHWLGEIEVSEGAVRRACTLQDRRLVRSQLAWGHGDSRTEAKVVELEDSSDPRLPSRVLHAGGCEIAQVFVS
jgi:hypothetical protein